MPRHVHKVAKNKPAKQLVQDIQAARNAKLEARKELLEHNAHLKLHSHKVEVQEKPKTSENTAAKPGEPLNVQPATQASSPKAASLLPEASAPLFTPLTQAQPEEMLKQPETAKKASPQPSESAAKSEQDAESAARYETIEQPLHDALDITESFLPAMAQTMQEVIKLQFQIVDMMTHNWMKLFQFSWFPPSPMND